MTVKQVVTVFGPVYTKRESQRYDDFPMMLSNLFSLKAMESFQIGVATHSGATPLVWMGTQSLVSSQLMPRWCWCLMQWLIHTTWDLDKDRDREKMGFNITLCPVHTTQGQAQGTIVFYCVHLSWYRSRAVSINHKQALCWSLSLSWSRSRAVSINHRRALCCRCPCPGPDPV